MKDLIRQFRQHSVAIISLVVALSSLTYNTWRNEQTEANRNVRTAGIELLLALGELERIVFFSHYDKDDIRGNPRAGWSYALIIVDLASLMADPATSSSEELLATWSGNWSGLGKDDESATAVSASIDKLRSDTLTVLVALD
jgi:hypothetical protein